LQNYPNPFNPVTYIRYRVARPGNVQLAIYNERGQEVVGLVDSYHNAGFYEIQWNGKTAAGTEAASGIYFYRLRVNGYIKTMKMLKLK
jgi:flagellar hook assembly protein FlgD